MSYQITENDIDRTKTLAGKTARKWGGSNLVDYDDVLGDGLEGLVQAAHRYDESRGHFWSFAIVYVNGYMRNGFRRRFGEKGQKLEMAKAASLNVTEDEDPNTKPLELLTEEDWNKGTFLLDKIRSLSLSPSKKKILIMLTAGYTQAEMARVTGHTKGCISRYVYEIRHQYPQEVLAHMIGA